MRAAIIAFSMYSRIPMPMFEWKEEDMKYAMCFFPAIGAVIGAVFFGMYLLLDRILTGKILQRGSSSQCRFLSRAGSTWTDLWTPAMQERHMATGRRSWES